MGVPRGIRARRWAATGAVAAVALLGVVAGCESSPRAEPSPETPSTAPTESGTPSPVVPPPPEPRRVSLVMGGDLLWHDTVWMSAAVDHQNTGQGARFDFDPMFADIKPLIEDADVALCHEEVPFAAVGGPLLGYPVFAAPPEIARWIASMGYDACTTASNHTLDQDFEGLVRTASLLDAAGVEHVGTFRTLPERGRPVILTTDNGVRVGIVAGTYGLNGFPLPEGREWSVSMWDAPNLLAQARAARASGADIVVVHIHGGTEYDHLPNAEQVELVRQLTESPYVDLVLGEHAHVVQPITKVAGKWVVYGMGNLVAQNEVTRPATYQGIVVNFEFVERANGTFGVDRAAYVPVAWNHWAPGLPPIRIHRLDQPGADQAARAAIAAAVNGLGKTPGLTGG